MCNIGDKRALYRRRRKIDVSKEKPLTNENRAHILHNVAPTWRNRLEGRTMLSASLNRLVLSQASRVKWHASANAPETFEDLRRAFATLGYIPVSTIGCETSIYGDASVNLAFRAWHDATHLAHGLGFNASDEIAVAHIQCASACIARDKALLWADVAGQVRYFEAFGEFPNDQTAFVLDYIACGIVRKRF
jgi:hypothetical protein